MTTKKENKIRRIWELFQQLTPAQQDEYLAWLRADLRR